VSSGASSTTTTDSGGAIINTETGIYNFGLGFIPDYVSPNGGHNNGISAGTQLMVVGGGYVTWSPVGDHEHQVPDHGHEINLPAHTHNMPHTHEVPAHTHDIEFGIYEGPVPSAIGLLVDGNVVPGSSISADDLDLLPYLSKDSEGKINRGQWHTIEIVPNSLGRVVASVVTQIFVQSRGGGDH
jgi:hypothetical protein